MLFSGEVDELSMRTDGGEIAFLAHHEDYVGAVDITVARLSVVVGESDTTTERIAVHGGFVHVNSESVTVLAGVAEPGAEIDIERARRALTEAEQRLEAEGPAVVASSTAGEEAETEQRLSGAMVALLAPESAEAAVARAKVRLEAAGAGISGS